MQWVTIPETKVSATKTTEKKVTPPAKAAKTENISASDSPVKTDDNADEYSDNG